jgi:uncharacterized protein (TIGR02118 family)
MAQILVLYPTPPDPRKFDDHYFGVHSGLACRLPGLRSLRVSRGPITSPQGSSPYHLIAQLQFDSRAALDAALQSDESRRATADLATFAPHDRRSFIFDTQVLYSSEGA